MASAVGAAAALKALDVGTAALDSISTSYYENDGVMAWWNEWEARDQRAHIEKVFNHGRFSRQHRYLNIAVLRLYILHFRTLGIPNGRWFCCMTQAALKAKGHKLDNK
jgi:hypothetical protein